MQFQRLRISGFKSFVDPIEFRIEPGLTGVVGPNGCGKSNLLESLRWVMGATSAKAMRAEGMDDVIFAGAQGRASRNHAEVLLQIDNRLEEASESLGAGGFETWRRVVLPLSLPGVFTGIGITFLTSMGAIVTPILLGGIRPSKRGKAC